MLVKMLVFAADQNQQNLNLEIKQPDLSLRKTRSETINPFLKIKINQKRSNSEEKEEHVQIKPDKKYKHPLKKQFKKDEQYKADLGINEQLRTSFKRIQSYLVDDKDLRCFPKEPHPSNKHLDDDYFFNNNLSKKINYHEKIDVKYISQNGKECRITRLSADEEIYQYLRVKLINVENHMLFSDNLNEILLHLKFFLKKYQKAFEKENLIIGLFSSLHPELINTTTKIKKENLVMFCDKNALFKHTNLPEQEDITTYAKALLELKSTTLWYSLENLNEVEKYCADQFLFNIVGTTDFYARKRSVMLNAILSSKKIFKQIYNQQIDLVHKSLQPNCKYSISQDNFLELSKMFIILSKASRITDKDVDIVMFLSKAYNEVYNTYEKYIKIKHDFLEDLKSVDNPKNFQKILTKFQEIENNFEKVKNFNIEDIYEGSLVTKNINTLQSLIDGYKFAQKNEYKLKYNKGDLLKNNLQEIKSQIILPQTIKYVFTQNSEKINNPDFTFNNSDQINKLKRGRKKSSYLKPSSPRPVVNQSKKGTRMLMELITEYKPSPKKLNQNKFEKINKKIHKEEQVNEFQFNVEPDNKLKFDELLFHDSQNNQNIRNSRMRTQSINKNNNIDLNFKDSRLVINNSKININSNFNKKNTPTMNNHFLKKEKIKENSQAIQQNQNKICGVYDCLNLDQIVQEKMTEKVTNLSNYKNIVSNFQSSYIEIFCNNLITSQQNINNLNSLDETLQRDALILLLSDPKNIDTNTIKVFLQATAQSILTYRDNINKLKEEIQKNMQTSAKAILNINQTYESPINNFSKECTDLQQILNDHSSSDSMQKILQK